MNITTTTGTMTLEDNELPSIDDMNEMIRAAIESHFPSESGRRHEEAFEKLCEASTAFDSNLTNAQFLAACASWLREEN